MSYEQTAKDIEATIGSLPGFMKEGLPQDVLVQMWPIMKKYVLGQSAIPPKYREMIALASAATMKCPYCEAFHRGVQFCTDILDPFEEMFPRKSNMAYVDDSHCNAKNPSCISRKS